MDAQSLWLAGRSHRRRTQRARRLIDAPAEHRALVLLAQNIAGVKAADDHVRTQGVYTG